MGRSKRNKIVALTKTKSKTKAHKVELVEKVKSYVDKFENIFVFSFHNMRTPPFREI